MSKNTGLPPSGFWNMMDDRNVDDSVQFITEFTLDPTYVEHPMSADDISLMGSTESNTNLPYSENNWSSTASPPGYPRTPESNMASAQNTGRPEMSYGALTPGFNPGGQRANSGQFAESGGLNPQTQLQPQLQPPETGRRQRRERRHETTGGFGGRQGEGLSGFGGRQVEGLGGFRGHQGEGLGGFGGHQGEGLGGFEGHQGEGRGGFGGHQGNGVMDDRRRFF